MLKYKSIIKGLATYVPGVNQFLYRGSGGTGSARYCYSVWLRHLVKAHENKYNCHPEVVAELGPGDSLGVGLAAMISGSRRYYAFDLMNHAHVEMNIRIFDELVSLFASRSSIPGIEEFPAMLPSLENYGFPSHILTDRLMAVAMEGERLNGIRESIRCTNEISSAVQYKAPWNSEAVMERESVDMILSQAVLEHVDDLRETYRAMNVWLKPDGFFSHQIDFRCHETADEWNGHWIYSDFIWHIIRGKQRYGINREPFSRHVALLDMEGFAVDHRSLYRSASRYGLPELAARFQAIPLEDLTTSSAFIQGAKRTADSSR